LTGAGPAGEVTYVDIRKRLASLTEALAGQLDRHRAEAEQAAAARGPAAAEGDTGAGG
jgi:hypothetical protein